MRQLLLLTVMVTCCIRCAAQSKDVRFLIDTTLTIMRNNSVAKVDWTALQETTLKKATGIDDPSQLGPVMRHVLESIGDFHGAFFYRDSTYKWRRNNERPVPDSVMAEWKKGVTIRSAMLGRKVGYLRVPYMSYNGKEDADKNAQMLSDSLCALLKNDIDGLVLDLRLNGGGAMYPMMLGLEALLGSGKIGSFTGKKPQSWYIKEHEFLLDTAVLTSLRSPCLTNAQNLPVVLLIGRGTGSSGEFLAMAFKGRKNTVFLGTATAGYITAVAGFPINQDAYLYLSTGYGADRNGHIHRTAILPDVVIQAPDCFNNIHDDQKISRAIKWIEQQKR